MADAAMGALSQKIGPAPVWMWGAGALGIVMVMRSRKEKGKSKPPEKRRVEKEYVNQIYTGPWPPWSPYERCGPDMDTEGGMRWEHYHGGEDYDREWWRHNRHPHHHNPQRHKHHKHVPVDPKPGGHWRGKYTVQPGDTMDTVARRYHTTLQQVAHANGFGSGTALQPGESLKVPDSAESGSLWLRRLSRGTGALWPLCFSSPHPTKLCRLTGL